MRERRLEWVASLGWRHRLPEPKNEKLEAIVRARGDEIAFRDVDTVGAQTRNAIRIYCGQIGVGDAEDIDRVIDDLVSVPKRRTEGQRTTNAKPRSAGNWQVSRPVSVNAAPWTLPRGLPHT